VTLRAVLFDAGDTLVRLRGRAGGLLLDAAAIAGVHLDPDAAGAVWSRVLAAASTPEELAKGRDLDADRHRAVWTELYRTAGADELAAGLAQSLYERTIDPSSWEAFPDAEPVLSELDARGAPVGVVSDTGFDLRPVFAATGLSRWIDAVVLSCEHGVCKPAPAVFATACDTLRVDPAETLMVGDNAATDGGAVAAGLTVLLLPPPQPAGPRGLDLVLDLVKAESRRPR
jgi:putative hydrolase of the HAD superfamily